MRLVRVVTTSALSILLTTAGFAYAQEQREEPQPQEESRPEAKPAQDEMKPKAQEQAKPDKRDENKRTEENKHSQDKAAKHEDDKSGQQDRATQSGQRADRRSAHIPDDKFRAHFGREHKFSIQRTTVQGQPGFQYGGYSFIIADPWPAGWAYTDDCYVDYIDGQYFLFDLLHPGVQIALVAVF